MTGGQRWPLAIGVLLSLMASFEAASPRAQWALARQPLASAPQRYASDIL